MTKTDWRKRLEFIEEIEKDVEETDHDSDYPQQIWIQESNRRLKKFQQKKL